MHQKLVILCLVVCIHFIYYIKGENNVISTQTSLQPHRNKGTKSPQEGSNYQIDKNAVFLNKNMTVDRTYQIKRKRIRKGRKRRNKIKKQLMQEEITESVLIKNVTSTNPTKKKNQKRRRRKKKHNLNNIREVANARPTNKSIIFKSYSEDKIPFPNLNIQTQANTTLHTDNKISNFSTATPKRKNRCLKNNGGCSQICKPKGKTKCACMKGYILTKSRKKCKDVNECRTKNGGCKEICRNTLGAFHCDCHLGFRLSEDSKSCQDINECHLRNSHGPCQDTCTNTHGSYICDCSNLNGTRLGKDKHSCEDINECEEANPGCSHLCINTRVGAFCSCPEGMELMTDYKTCQDVDECEEATVKSTCLRGCVNTIGSYYCEEDFQNDQYFNRTKLSACPPLDLPRHGFITCFRNNTLPYDTFTKNGRKIIRNSPGTKCQLECPIGFKLLGGGRFVCGIDGKWIVRKKGLCIKSPYPKLQCPPDQAISLKGQQKVSVQFSPPQTNIRWWIVKSYPEWAKNLKGELGEGRHAIQFSVTDPASRLSSICSFSIVVKK